MARSNRQSVMVPPELDNVELDTYLIDQLNALHKELDNQREQLMAAFMGDPGDTVMINIILGRMVSSFRQYKEGAGPHKGKLVANSDFQRQSWTSRELHENLPDSLKGFLTAADVESKLLSMSKAEPAETRVVHTRQNGPVTGYTVNHAALQALTEK